MQETADQFTDTFPSKPKHTWKVLCSFWDEWLQNQTKKKSETVSATAEGSATASSSGSSSGYATTVSNLGEITPDRRRSV
jgi:hypothetical protein